MLKLMIVGRRRGGMTVAQLHRYMLDTHGAMVVRLIAEQPRLTPQRYVQNHVFDGSTRVPQAGLCDPLASSRDFVTQVWFDDPAQAQASLEAPFYRAQLRPDEDRFVDQTSVVRLPVVEEPVFGDARAAGRSKLFVFHQRAESVSPDDLAVETLAAWQPLLADAAPALERLVRNRVVARPGDPAAADLVDEVWLRDDAAARDVGERWQTLWGERRGALQAPGTGFVLLAREHRLFEGRAA